MIIGNPPYGVAFDSRSKAFLKGNYKAAEYQFDSFALFIEKALSLLKKDGFQSYITPTTWLSEHYYENLRGLILADNQLQQVIFFKEHVFKDATVETCIEIINKDQPNLNSKLMLGIVSDKPEGLSINWTELKQKQVENFEGKRITEYLTPDILNLFERVSKKSVPLKRITLMTVGCKPYQIVKGSPPQTKEIVDARLFDSDYKKDDTYKPYLRGEDFYKYDLDPQESRWISYGEWLAEPRPSAPFFASKKIVIRQTADTLIATIDTNRYINLNNVHNLVLNVENFSLEFILSLLNSEFLSFVHRVFVPEFGRVFAEVKIVNLEKLPIRQISFVTSRECRKKLFNEAESHYKKFLETSKPDTFLCFIESRITREHKPDAELVKKHNADSLNKDWKISEGILWEQSDVVHDTLEFLAEQMIEMNKDKQREIKGYLEWIEGQLKIQQDSEENKTVDTLTGKTQIKNYLGDYQKNKEPLPFEEFWKILEKNKAKIQANLKSRELYENIKSEYEKSLSKLLPLKEKLHKTDWLIDQIVYKLYGLTEEEIKVVEQG
ncbi:MAG: Eco57I restriction-modification methylase domain-containing protein [candidate division Zixibacteria bacterium]|nr:Eco57I restriction-modification methylase domain-containing protein [candidate division Zixibacteria bacterium]